MALIKFGGGVTQASGSIGGNTFARNRFGNYFRNRTKPVNPQSTAQGLIRSSLAYLSQYWNATLTPAERGSWETYAGSVPSLNRLGESVYLTGFNEFLRSNIIRLQNELAVIEAGPTILTLPETDPTFAIVATTTDQKIAVTFDETLPWASESGAKMYIYAGEPQNPTRNFFKGPWKLAGSLANGAETGDPVNSPFTLVTGQKIWCYARIQRADGRLSSPFRSDVLVTAGA